MLVFQWQWPEEWPDDPFRRDVTSSRRGLKTQKRRSSETARQGQTPHPFPYCCTSATNNLLLLNWGCLLNLKHWSPRRWPTRVTIKTTVLYLSLTFLFLWSSFKTLTGLLTRTHEKFWSEVEYDGSLLKRAIWTVWRGSRCSQAELQISVTRTLGDDEHKDRARNGRSIRSRCWQLKLTTVEERGIEGFG